MERDEAVESDGQLDRADGMRPLPPVAKVPPGGRLRDRRLHLDADPRRDDGGGTRSSGQPDGGPESEAKVASHNPSIPTEILEKQLNERRNTDKTPTGIEREPSQRWRPLLMVAIVLPAVVVGYFLVSLLQVWSTGTSEEARDVDAIVVMGAAQYDGRPSPQLAARLDHVAELWPQGLAPLIVVTGGNQPGDRFTEAEASANYLINRGVPEESIIRESTGSNSYESLDQVEQLLRDVVGEESTVLIVTDPYHSLRSKLIAEEVGMEAFVSPTSTSVVTGANSLERHVWEAGGVAIGRISGFRWLSDITS